MRKISIMLLVALLMSTLFCSVYADKGNSNADSTAPDEVIAAAQEGLESAKEMMSTEPEMWGFNNADEIKEVTLGEGMQVNFVSPEKLEASDENSLLELIDSAQNNNWEFEVNLNGEPKVYITVDKTEEGYKMIGFGGRPEILAAAKDNFKKLKPDEGVKLVKAGRAYYLAAKVNGKEKVLPVMTSEMAKSYGKMDFNQAVSPKEVVKFLKEVQKSGKDNKPGGQGPIAQTGNGHFNSLIILGALSLAGFAFALYKSGVKA